MTVKFARRTEEVEYVEDITCNRCGKSTSINGSFQGLKFRHTYGYESKYDLQRWTGDLCQACSDDFERWLKLSGGKIDKFICTVDGHPLMTIEEYERELASLEFERTH